MHNKVSVGAKAIGIVVGVVLLIIIGLGFVGSLHLLRPGQSTGNTSTTNTPGVTLEDIIAGKFPSATDKQGTGGVVVTVDNLLVLYVHTESDGDWHVAVTDGTVAVFITEITPAYQSSLGMPLAGSTIDETGISYCDTNHQTASWHGNTCWEIHPIISWQPSH